MRLIKTTPAPPPDAMPRFKTRRSPQKVWLIVWMLALTVMLAFVLFLLAHLALGIDRTLTSLTN